MLLTVWWFLSCMFQMQFFTGKWGPPSVVFTTSLRRSFSDHSVDAARWLTDWMFLLWHLTNRRWNYNARIDKWYSLYDKKHYSLQFAYMSSQYEFLYSSLVIKSQSLRCPWCSWSSRLRCGVAAGVDRKAAAVDGTDRQTDGHRTTA